MWETTIMPPGSLVHNPLSPRDGMGRENINVKKSKTDIECTESLKMEMKIIFLFNKFRLKYFVCKFPTTKKLK